ncbi:MAG TPA: DUF3800 domain-containing protein [Candidatus Angelobacter sp.]|jgi:hypothetical protein
MVKISFRVQAPETMVAFCDESCHNAHHFFVLGALFFAFGPGADVTAAIRGIEEQLKKKKEEYGLLGRVKWQKIPSRAGRFLDGYKALVRDVLETENVYFKAMVVDTHKHPLDNKKRWAGDQLVGYSKFYCVFLSDGLMSRFRNYFFDFTIDQFEFRPDCDVRLLQRTAEWRFIRKGKPQPYLNHCRITTADHRDSNLLQIVDLLVGAVSFCWNQTQRSHSAREASKLEIVELIKSMTGTDPGEATAWAKINFNIWELDPND